MARELRDINSNHEGEPDLAFLQRKIAAAGEMKTAIKRFLDLCDEGGSCPVCTTPRTRPLRKAMEDYLNVV